MNKRFLISALILIGTILADQLSKQWGETLPSLYYNQGFILGMYSGLPASIRIVGMGSLAGIIFTIYVFFMYLIPRRARSLKYGLSFLVGGMFGNVLDKILYGRTTDFIPFGPYVFNLADVFLWFGALWIFYFIFRQDKLIWYPNSNRGNFLIWPREQFKVGMTFFLLVFCSALVFGIFSYSFFNVSISFGAQVPESERLMRSFILTYLFITLLMSLLAFVAGTLLGHRSVGPLHAFSLFVDDLIAGKNRELRFRDYDNYKKLEAVAERLRKHFSEDK